MFVFVFPFKRVWPILQCYTWAFQPYRLKTTIFQFYNNIMFVNYLVFFVIRTSLYKSSLLSNSLGTCPMTVYEPQTWFFIYSLFLYSRFVEWKSNHALWKVNCFKGFIGVLGLGGRRVHSGNVGTGLCGPDRVLFRPLRFTNDPFFIWKLV